MERMIVSCMMNRRDLDRLDGYVQSGRFNNRSEAIRFLLRSAMEAYDNLAGKAS